MKKRGPIYCAMLVIGCLELFALSQGIDGVLMGLVIALIAGLGGYTTKGILRK